MNTAIIRYNPEETFGSIPEYSIPDRPDLIFMENINDSGPDNADKFSYSSTDVEAESIKDTPKLAIVPPVLQPLKGKFQLLQLWEGRIIDIRESEFEAIISDKTNPDLDDEMVTIEMSEISPDDQSIIQRGSVFYWSIGYLDYPGRGRVRESKIRFRRLTGWSAREIDHAKKVGKRFAEYFKSSSI